MFKPTLALIERFHEKWKKDPKTGCWLWTGATGGKGYGFIKRPGERRQIYAHRLSYIIHVGDIPDGMMVCHTCDTLLCVRPTHLFLGTGGDNLQDMKGKDRHLYGVRNVRHKLTDDQVRQMHRLHREGVSTHGLGEMFGISQGQAWRIINGKRWEHIYREFHPRADG